MNRWVLAAVAILLMGASGARASTLPDFIPSGEDFYPKSAARELRQGTVRIEFQIDADGRARNIEQRSTDHADFSETTQAYLESGRFRIPADWSVNGGADVRFAVEVQYSIARGSGGCDKKPPYVADTQVLVICKLLSSRRQRGLR